MKTTIISEEKTDNVTSSSSLSIPQTMNLRIRVLHAIDYPEIAKECQDSHQEVLKSFNVELVSLSKSNWWNNPSCYLFIIEDMFTCEIAASIRLHVKDETNSIPLEDAINKDEIEERIRRHKLTTGEICGLWVKKTFSQRNLPFHLVRSVLSVAPKLRIQNLITFLPKHTKDVFFNLGFEVVKEIGHYGEFQYPDERYVSTVMELRNLFNLVNLKEDDRNIIKWLRSNPKYVISEKYQQRECIIIFDLRLL